MTKTAIVIRGKIIIISGCPRSGTSLCMDVHRKAYGEEIIMGLSLLGENVEDDIAKRQAEHLKNIIQQAINFIPCCTELCDKEKQAYEKGWEDGAKVGADDVSSRM